MSESPIAKRSLTLKGRHTSVSLEDDFWEALKEIAAKRSVTVSELVRAIDDRREGYLSPAIRLFVLDYYQKLDD